MITIVHIIDPWDHAGPLNWSHSHGGLRLINPCEYATVIWSCFYHAHYNKLSDQKLFGVIMHRYVRTTSPVSFASATDAAHAHICILKTLLLLVGDVWNLSVFVALSQHCADALTPVRELWRYLDNRRCTFRWGHLVHQCVPPPGQIWYVFNQIPVHVLKESLDSSHSYNGTVFAVDLKSRHTPVQPRFLWYIKKNVWPICRH